MGITGLTIAAVSLIFSRFSFSRTSRWAALRQFEIALTACRGTRFCGANLTQANFTGSTLKNTDFRGANLTQT
jgi:uncharacterized protein YjbI with pentapeptide repeats